MFTFEGVNHEDNDERGETGRSSLIDWVANVAVFFVTQYTEFSREVTPKDNDKVDKRERTHEETVKDEVDVEFEGENLVESRRGQVHGVDSGRFETESQSGRTSSERVDP